ADGIRVRGKSRVVRWALALAIPVAAWVGGEARMAMLAASEAHVPTVRIGIVQPNTPLSMGQPEEKLRRLHAESARLQREGAEIIVWPEAGAYPYLIARPFLVDRPGRRQILAEHTTPTIVGVAT